MTEFSFRRIPRSAGRPGCQRILLPSCGSFFAPAKFITDLWPRAPSRSRPRRHRAREHFILSTLLRRRLSIARYPETIECRLGADEPRNHGCVRCVQGFSSRFSIPAAGNFGMPPRRTHPVNWVAAGHHAEHVAIVARSSRRRRRRPVETKRNTDFSLST